MLFCRLSVTVIPHFAFTVVEFLANSCQNRGTSVIKISCEIKAFQRFSEISLAMHYANQSYPSIPLYFDFLPVPYKNYGLITFEPVKETRSSKMFWKELHEQYLNLQ